MKPSGRNNVANAWIKNHGDIELQKSLLVQTPDHINLMMLQLWHSCCPFNYWIYKG